MGLLDNFDDDEDDEVYSDTEQREFAHIQLVDGRNDLRPPAPPGWWAVMRFSGAAAMPYPVEIGGWLLILGDIQVWEQTLGVGWKFNTRPMHQVSRDLDGRRVLLVHPDLHAQAHDRILEYDNAARCSCGEFHLEPDMVEAALLSIVGRIWDRASLPDRFEQLDHLENQGVDASVMLQQASSWMREYASFWWLYELGEGMHLAARRSAA